jgi:hypothetical protein
VRPQEPSQVQRDGPREKIYYSDQQKYYKVEPARKKGKIAQGEHRSNRRHQPDDLKPTIPAQCILDDKSDG